MLGRAFCAFCVLFSVFVLWFLFFHLLLLFTTMQELQPFISLILYYVVWILGYILVHTPLSLKIVLLPTRNRSTPITLVCSG
ncbi:hypothetical protein QBC38DRAFT_149166 [Podospora fimiseda]|uniref:Uncharacterized protein n=1 Tax=Podospora fimiseda TaxID=252190 RepID=A0AAN7BF35_9PEZI|nr:hypothetical protein QBC38DRAFT_149166 [Podospora fimiseda]